MTKQIKRQPPTGLARFDASAMTRHLVGCEGWIASARTTFAEWIYDQAHLRHRRREEGGGGKMSHYIVKADDPGKASAIAWAAAVLYARTVGMAAENTERERNGHTLAYPCQSFEDEVSDAYAGLVAMGCDVEFEP